MRYSKQIKLPGFGLTSQQKLAHASLLVIGAGGLGCTVLQYLVAAGIGKIGIVDYDIVEVSNLPRQVLYSTEDVGKLKVEVAARRLKEMNSDVNIEIFPYKLTQENGLNLIKNYTIVADCTDNFIARYLINDICISLEKPWVFASIEGWEGQVSVFNFNNGPSYRCIFPEAPLDAPNCDDLGITGTVAASTASMQANEILKCITGIGNTMSGKLWVMNFYNNSFNFIEFKRNEKNFLKVNIERNSKPIMKHDLEISVEDYLQNTANYFLVDIRDRHDYEDDPSEGENIPFDELLKALGRINSDKRYLLLCLEGRKSLFVAYHVKEKYKIDNVYSLDGGWQKLKLVVKEI